MKKHLAELVTFIYLIGISCEEKIDIEKEKEAIKAVFEADKAAYFNQDYVGMGECWVKTLLRLRFGHLTRASPKWLVGKLLMQARRMRQRIKVGIENKVKATFLNYQIDIMDEGAWVVCEALWEGIWGSDTINLKQNRIFY